LEDVAPTLLDLVGSEPDERFDGVSLAPLLRNQDSEAFFEQLGGRLRFSETEFAPAALMSGSVNEHKLIKEAAILYTLAPNGRLELRPQGVEAILRRKQLGVFAKDSALISVPVLEGGHEYFWFPPSASTPARFVSPPDARTSPAAASLWLALSNRFPGELQAAPASVD
jgi:hypothetical protein